MPPVSMPDRSRKAITLVLGGVRSGKSRYVQTLAAGISPVAFVATARPSDSDEEMRLKIERHRTERPPEWHTIEEPLHIDRVLVQEGSNYRMLLVDCLTPYAANLHDAERGNLIAVGVGPQCLYAALVSVPCSVALVSNEVGGVILPVPPEPPQHRALLGEINQRVPSAAENVLLMVA